MKRACKLFEERMIHDEAVVAFFFNSRGVSMESRLGGFLRSTLHQLLRRHGSHRDDAFTEWKRKCSLIQSGWTWTVEELQDMFVRYVVRLVVKVAIFVDALDECEPPANARKLMNLLTNTHHGPTPAQLKQPQLKICISSRNYPNISVDEPLRITVEDTNHGAITQYVQKALRHLQVDLSDDFATEITSRSSGIFLWATLVIEKIREALDDGEPRGRLRAIIDHTPPQLEEVFRDLFNSIPTNERERSNRILSWILFAKRPLSLSELNHALAFGSEARYQTYSAYENSDDFVGPGQMRLLLAKYTRGLTETVNGPTDRVQFIHESVRQYVLLGQGVINPGSDADWSNLGLVDDLLAKSCFSYIKAVCTELGVVNDIVRRLQDRGFQPGQLSKDHTKDRPFLEYAIQSAFAHAKTADLSGRPPSYLFQSNINAGIDNASWWNAFTSVFRLYWKRGYHSSRYPPDINHWSECATTPVAFACAYQLDSWVGYLLEDDQTRSNSVELSKALCVAASSGYWKGVALLVEAGADVDYEDPILGTPLYISLRIGRDDFVVELLNWNATARMGSRNRSPLVAAVLNRPKETVRLLLDAGAEVTEDRWKSWEINCAYSTSSRDRPRGSHSLEAALERDTEILEALLPYAERQQVPVEYYRAAYLAAGGIWFSSYRGAHAQKLKSAMSTLFPGSRTKISFRINTLNGRNTWFDVWDDTTISTMRDMFHQQMGYRPYVLVYRNRHLRDDQTLHVQRCVCWIMFTVVFASSNSFALWASSSSNSLSRSCPNPLPLPDLT
ncbi:hypothetical protein OPT61_g3352 [Boeremia exigua]|uniref:Uncharacterized protein n=1 Tax=Boeremia exigua TaxID=749465 RepID=A0ACC2II45_9PLEO|nr:hypothetical protein OPT61_g3352 [Boeremia exigua]